MFRCAALLLAGVGALAASAASAQVDPPAQPRGPAYSPPQPAAPGSGQAPAAFDSAPDQVIDAARAARTSALNQPADQALVHHQAGEQAHAGQLAAVRSQDMRDARRRGRSWRSPSPLHP